MFCFDEGAGTEGAFVVDEEWPAFLVGKKKKAAAEVAERSMTPLMRE